MADHRQPPKPKHWNAPIGTCRFCGDPVNEPRRRRWHSACAEVWGVANAPSYAQFKVWERDQGRCAGCGIVGCWEVDHIKPLAEANGDFSYWLMGNLQTLCGACHKAKTKAEHGRRAKERRLRWKHADLGKLAKPRKAEKPVQLALPW